MGITAAIIFLVCAILFALLLRQFARVPNRWAVLLALPLAALAVFWSVRY